MERDESNLADALDRHWDALLRGDGTSATADLDADLLALVTRLQAAGSAIPPLFSDPDRAWQELPQAAPPARGRSNEEQRSPAWPQPNGYTDLFAERQPAPPRPRRGGGWVLAQLATAALLLLLAVGFIAIRQRIPETRDQERWVPALVRALEGSPGGIIDTPLIETTFTTEELPDGQKEVLYYQLTIPPGVSLPYLGASFCGCSDETLTAGAGVEVVQSGAYTLRLEAPLRVQRGGSTRPTEDVPAGTEVTLAAGDAVIYPDYAAPGDIRNAGAEPVTLIGAAIIAMEGSGTPLPTRPPQVRAELLTISSSTDWETFPPGPVHLGLRQVTLSPGTSVGPFQPVGLQALWIESGTVAHNFVRAGDTEPRGKPINQLPGTTIPFMHPLPGLREILATAGEQPAETLVLIIEPAVMSEQSLTP